MKVRITNYFSESRSKISALILVLEKEVWKCGGLDGSEVFPVVSVTQQDGRTDHLTPFCDCAKLK
jgi:hypothetical protein